MSQISSVILGTTPTTGPVLTLTGNTGGAVSPTGGGTINVIGDASGTITVAGNIGTNTLTITDSSRVTSSVQTTDATPTTLYSLTLANNRAATLNALVAGAKSDYSAAIGGLMTGTARKQGAGVAIEVDDTPSPAHDSGTGNPTVQFVVSGNDIILQVTGEAGITYNWTAVIDRIILSA